MLISLLLSLAVKYALSIDDPVHASNPEEEIQASLLPPVTGMYMSVILGIPSMIPFPGGQLCLPYGTNASLDAVGAGYAIWHEDNCLGAAEGDGVANNDKPGTKTPEPSMLTGTGVSLVKESLHASNPMEEEFQATPPVPVTSDGKGGVANDNEPGSKMPQPSVLTGASMSLANESVYANNPAEEEIQATPPASATGMYLSVCNSRYSPYSSISRQSSLCAICNQHVSGCC